ncbi:sugar transferase [Lignipirellula cremea]|uniref:Undecaprenyl-phosphate N-acetylgalactosaminyl 1-phosphate transferase n=1 Tax=Lignipirellula cremea TaxID=2528010 RepID=A0A518DMJ6_9BACT|nr:sugar transferase [Lignipirellula cremea]QDU93060.1 Putative undecaprenyl-phosphate N-acetylgalactosaminyl 1-phosphate transferase [Lignipirellula cremea]
MRYPSVRPRTSIQLGLFDRASSDSFRSALEREQSRSNRSGQTFGLLVFQFDSQKSMRRDIEQFLTLLLNRVRGTDEVGLLDRRRLGVLLPDTDIKGARLLAQSLTEACGENIKAPDCEIFIHPLSAEDAAKAAPQDADSDDDDDSSGGHAQEVRPLESLFIRPTPFWKRCLDIVGSVLGLVLVSPILLLAAVLIKLTSPGPIVFTQPRDGLGGRPFLIYKFRTMYIDAEARKAALREFSEQDGPAFKMQNDPRITPLGSFLRKSCIDELPQLWNVLKGEMSLVGPRPLPCDESAGCQGWQRRRLEVTPGLTCIWQLDGGRRVSFAEWMRMDIRYIGRRGPLEDVQLIARTAFRVLTHRASV